MTSSHAELDSLYAKLESLEKQVGSLKLLERELRESEEQFRLIVENSPNYVWIFQDRKLVYLNPAVAKALGKDPAEVMTFDFSSLLTIFSPESQAFITTSVSRLAAGEELEIHDLAFRLPNNEERQVRGLSRKITFRGQPAYLSIFADVTDLKILEAELKRQNENLEQEVSLRVKELMASETRYQELLENANDAIYVIDLTGRFISANRKSLEITGYTHEEIGKLNIGDLLSSEEYQKQIGVIERIAKGLDLDPYEIEVIAKSGKRINLELNLRPLLRDNQIIGIEGIARDITKRKELEAELQNYNRRLEEMVAARTRALEDKTLEMEKFIYTVSHDLKAPLISIIGFASLLLDKGLFPASSSELNYLERIQANALKMSTLFDKLLELSRIGRMEEPQQLVSSAVIVQQVLQELEVWHKEQHAELCVADNLPVVYFSHLRLYQIFNNLITNAVKFHTPETGPKVEINCREDMGFWIFSIKDNGIGIDAKDQQKIFEVFTQLGEVEASGNGLGLTIVRNILEKNGGRVWVESEKGHGSTFFFSIPKAGGQPKSE